MAYYRTVFKEMEEKYPLPPRPKSITKLEYGESITFPRSGIVVTKKRKEPRNPIVRETLKRWGAALKRWAKTL